jgi:photosynthetic reaction center cytochrome c subunit
MKRTLPLIAFCAIVVTSAVAAAQTAAGPQGGRGVTGTVTVPPPPPMTNLQVFPKDAPRQQVVAAMQQFTQALGVRCEYCHVDDPATKVDMASDEKQTKKTARAMILMTGDINVKVPEAAGKTADSATRVACVTCHRGVAVPRQLADILGDTASTKGMPAALAEYKDLRARYFGGMAYDFSEAGLLGVVQRPNTKPDDAIAWLQLNLEYYPKSARTYVAMSQVHQRANDREAAIKDLETALELDPANVQAKRMLDALKAAK